MRKVPGLRGTDLGKINFLKSYDFYDFLLQMFGLIGYTDKDSETGRFLQGGTGTTETATCILG